MRRIDNDTYELSTSRRFYANRGIVGMGDPTDRDSVPEGCDGSIGISDPSIGQPWTDAERAELAAFMMDQWREWGFGGMEE